MSKFKISRRPVGLLDVISQLLENGEYFGPLPEGVISVDLVTPEAVKVMFADRVDYNLFCEIAIEEGYKIDAAGYTPRVVDEGNIIARVGSKSDPGLDCNIFIYIFPPLIGAMSIYMRSAAIRFGILNPENNKLDMEKLLAYNLKVIRLVEKYRKRRYKDIIRELET